MKNTVDDARSVRRHLELLRTIARHLARLGCDEPSVGDYYAHLTTAELEVADLILSNMRRSEQRRTEDFIIEPLDRAAVRLMRR